MVGAGRQAARAPPAPGARGHAGSGGGGGGLRGAGFHRHPAPEDPGRHRPGLPAHQAQVPPGMGSLHGGGGAIHLPQLHLPHRLQCRLLTRRHRYVQEARSLPSGHDRAAAGRRRHEPDQSRRPAAADRDAGVSRRERAEPRPCAGGHPAGELQGGQHQDGPRGRAHRVAGHPGPVRRARHSLLGRGHAGERGGRRHLRRAGHPAQLHLCG